MLGISFLFLVACSWQNKYQNSESIDLNDFKMIEPLKGSVITFDSIIMKPWLLQVYDTLLITCNLNTDKLFHVFDLKKQKTNNSAYFDRARPD
jgi:hypothetical protein